LAIGQRGVREIKKVMLFVELRRLKVKFADVRFAIEIARTSDNFALEFELKKSLFVELKVRLSRRGFEEFNRLKV